MFNFIEPGNRCTYVHSSIAGLILSQIVKYLCRDYSQGRTVADRFSMFGQSVIVQMSVSTLHPHSFPPTQVLHLQAGDQFRVMLVRGCLGVDGGQYLSFLGHRLAPSLP